MIYFTHPSAFNDPFEMEPYFALPELDPKTGAASPASFGSVLKAGGALKLLKVSSRNHDLLSITRLVTVFESFDSDAEAVQSFEPIAAPPLSR